MVVLDENIKYGLRLVIEDYLFVVDGFEFWSVIKGWIGEYVGFIYFDDECVQDDKEF